MKQSRPGMATEFINLYIQNLLLTGNNCHALHLLMANGGRRFTIPAMLVSRMLYECMAPSPNIGVWLRSQPEVQKHIRTHGPVTDQDVATVLVRQLVWLLGQPEIQALDRATRR